MITTQIINFQPQIQPLTNLRHNVAARYNLSSPIFNKNLNKDTVCFTSNSKKEIAIEEMEREYNDIMEGYNEVNSRFHSMNAYKKALDNFDVKNFIRLGMESAVFELDSGDILKLSCEEYPDYISKYHAPEVKRGTIKLPQKYNAIDKYLERISTDEVHYVIQKKGTPVTDVSEANKLWDMAIKENLNVQDFDTDQFAYFDTPSGKEIKCVDLGCITDKNYPKLRTIKVVQKKTPEDACRHKGFLYWALYNSFENGIQVGNYLETVKTRLEAGENIFDILSEKIEF